VHGTREGLALGEDGETIGKGGHVVLGGHVHSLDGLVTLRKMESIKDAFRLTLCSRGLVGSDLATE
jgi:hypothetical protein